MNPIIAVVGPSRSGKSTLIREVIQREPTRVALIPTVHTRARRPDDEVGHEFVDVSVFNFLDGIGELVESVQYAGNKYGIRRAALDAILHTRLGIGPFTEKAVKILRERGYRVYVIEILPHHGEETTDHLRKLEDLRRKHSIEPDYVLFNDFDKNGLQDAVNDFSHFIRAIKA